jgi:hypothetical protein
MNKEPCNECLRREVIECLEKAEQELPEEFGGFGKHEGYVMGVVDGTRFALQKCRDEIEKLHEEIMNSGRQE